MRSCWAGSSGGVSSSTSNSEVGWGRCGPLGPEGSMSETRRGRPGTGWPRGLLGMMGLVVAGELHLARHDADFTTMWASDWERTGWAATRRAPGCDVLLFG